MNKTKKTTRKLKRNLKLKKTEINTHRAYLASLNAAAAECAALLRSLAQVLDNIRAHHLPLE